jgi:antitoxin component YwqK of YwqJK toxin-antitoxin module
MKKYLFVLILITLYACKREKRSYYPTGEIQNKYYVNNYNKIDGNFEEYYPDGTLMIKKIYKNGLLKDSSIYYTKNGKIGLIRSYIKKGITYDKFYRNFDEKKISEEGYFLNNNKIGKWKYFDEYGNVNKVFEYVNVCGEQYTNQGWIYSETGQIIKKESNYFSIKTNKKEFVIGEAINIKIHYEPYFGDKSESLICISPKIEESFCNLNTEKLDTIYSCNHNFNFQISFAKSGKKNARGIIKEIYYDKVKNQTGERILYFDIPLLIKK